MFAKALFGQVGDHVDQVRDQVGEGQGQELDNTWKSFNEDIKYFEIGQKSNNNVNEWW